MKLKVGLILMAAVLVTSGAQAEFVTIGDAGNTADIYGYGAVAYTYQISATEVTIAEFQQATGAGSGDEDYWNNYAVYGTSAGTNAPAGNVTLYEAMKYCNYLTSGNVNNGVYQFSGGSYQSTERASAVNTYGTVYALPTEDEWYKAAYYTGNSGDLWSSFANGTDSTPTRGTADGWNFDYANPAPNYIWAVGYGGEEQNGTHNMMGNVWEWMEDSGGVIRGGVCFSLYSHLRSDRRYDEYAPSFVNYGTGFRVVAIPEPSCIAMIGMLSGCALLIRRTRKKG